MHGCWLRTRNGGARRGPTWCGAAAVDDKGAAAAARRRRPQAPAAEDAQPAGRRRRRCALRRAALAPARHVELGERAAAGQVWGPARLCGGRPRLAVESARGAPPRHWHRTIGTERTEQDHRVEHTQATERQQKILACHLVTSPPRHLATSPPRHLAIAPRRRSLTRGRGASLTELFHGKPSAKTQRTLPEDPADVVVFGQQESTFNVEADEVRLAAPTALPCELPRVRLALKAPTD